MRQQFNKKFMKEKKSSRNLLFLLLVVLITFCAYLPALKNGWTKWDDTKYILENSSTNKISLENIKKIFTQPVQGNYIPVTFLSFALERTFLGEQPRVFIFINIVLHLLNTILVFFLIQLLIKDSWTSTVCALVFGLHPMHVESVAWIAERKDVLYSLYFFLSIITYLKYINSEKIKWFVLSLLLMLLSVLSKSIAVVLPFILMALDYFFARKFSRKIILEKIPFILILLICIYIAKSTIESNVYNLSNYNLSFIDRIAIASFALVKYVILLLIPVNLSAYYPYPFLSTEAMPVSLWFYFLLTVASIVLLIWYGLKNNNRILIFSTTFFVVNLFPLLQLFPVGDAVMADRFIYMASVGFFLPIVYAGKVLGEKKALRNVINALVVICSVCLFYLTYQRCSIWKNAKTLWTDTIKKNSNVSVSHVNLGSISFEEGKIDSATYHYTKAIEIDCKNKQRLCCSMRPYF